MKKKISPLLILCAAVCFSCGGFFSKSIPWGPIAIAGGRALLASVAVFIYMKLKHHKIVFNKSVLLCGACIAVTSYLWSIASKLTSSAAAIILEYTAPVFIILLSFLFFRKKPTKLDIIIIPVIIAGVVCFFFDSLASTALAPNPLLGNLIGLGSGLTYAVVFMMKMLPGSDNLSSIFVGCIIGAVIGMPMIVTELFTPGQTNGTVLLMIALMGLIQYATPYICMAEGLEHTPAFAASLIGTVEPILNPLITAAILHETVGFFTILGAVVILGSIIIYNLLTSHLEKKAKVSHKEIA